MLGLLLAAAGCGPLLGLGCARTELDDVTQRLPAEFRALPEVAEPLWVPGGRAWVGEILVDSGSGNPLADACEVSVGRWLRIEGVFLDADEVRVRDYAVCVAEGACPGQAGSADPDFPMTLERSAAEAYCSFRGGRLPTLGELTRAATGGSLLPVPQAVYAEWKHCERIDYLDDACAALVERSAIVPIFSPYLQRTGPSYPVRSAADDLGPFGHWDIHGSQLEWVSSEFSPNAAQLNEACLLDVPLPDPGTYTYGAPGLAALYSPTSAIASAAPLINPFSGKSGMGIAIANNLTSLSPFFGARCAYDAETFDSSEESQ